ncbi:hypothetical protein [Noviherbaspirillum sedimenti]|uniref:Uncharacterized protein n=1 Tax=Noviherbaspirillum sedimenti TaxID=2320865 RepID=A0A3A3G690_9BURK|nr:hypothetical protein [Noviherbaspirillum sedimenti]RJG03958.1 hypothetical protein D3878_22145 [Noviherbaspirillum sedimenti]
MSAHQMARMAELENQAFALMGRLHVALRRETGRITDVEYMRIDPDYCRYLIQLALQSSNPEVQKIGERLDTIYFDEAGLFMLEPPKPPLLAHRNLAASATSPIAPPAPRVAIQKLAQNLPPAPTIPATSSAPPESSQHYVGRLR